MIGVSRDETGVKCMETLKTTAVRQPIRHGAQASPQPAQQSVRLLVIDSQTTLIFFAALILVTGMLIFILSAIGGVRYTLTRPNPFAHYGSILPGEAASILARYDCEKAPGAERFGGRFANRSPCFIFPRDEWFHLILVHTRDGQITEVLFFSESLQPEILFASWGQPHHMGMTAERRGVTLYWDRGWYAAKVMVGQEDHVARLITMTVK